MTERQAKLINAIYTHANRIVSHVVDIKLNYPKNSWNINYVRKIEEAERELVSLNMAMGELLPNLKNIDKGSYHG